jgi:hypothetical protein
MNTPAIAGDHLIVAKPSRKPLPWSIAITGTLITVLLIAVAHLSHLGPGIDNAEAVTNIGKYLCQGNSGLKRITLRALPGTYTFHCRDGAMHHDVRIEIKDPQA